MLEYDDYVRNPTAENASEFLYRAIEDNFQSATSISTYADYIATRPRAEKIGKHGLFSNEGDAIVLSQVSAELNRHEGNMWTMIVSLRREDAERLSFDNAIAWRELLRAHTSELADALKIPLSELKWYAAFHKAESSLDIQTEQKHLKIMAVGCLAFCCCREKQMGKTFSFDRYTDAVRSAYKPHRDTGNSEEQREVLQKKIASLEKEFGKSISLSFTEMKRQIDAVISLAVECLMLCATVECEQLEQLEQLEQGLALGLE